MRIFGIPYFPIQRWLLELMWQYEGLLTRKKVELTRGHTTSSTLHLTSMQLRSFQINKSEAKLPQQENTLREYYAADFPNLIDFYRYYLMSLIFFVQ
mgnify:CR=1 FL=1